MRLIELTANHVKFIGRGLSAENVRWTALSGAGVAFHFWGKKLSITLVGSNNAFVPDNTTCYARFAILVDGQRVVDEVMDKEQKSYTIFDEPVAGKLTVQVIKLSESAMSAIGIKPLLCDDEAVVEALPAKKHSLEFIGDSITCGYGVDDRDMSHTFSTGTEDVTKAYAYKTAQLLDADYSMFSCSGYGIISGYTPDPQVRGGEELIPPYYEAQCFCRDHFGSAGKPAAIPWDFQKYQPEAVVINLGTNDDSFCQDTEWKREEYRQAYVNFLKLVRKHNPQAHIFCVLGLMGDRLYDKMCQAGEDYRAETQDEWIHMVYLPKQEELVEGYVIDYHPLPEAHTMAAQVVAEAIRKQLGW